jgi:hypothetical protein
VSRFFCDLFICLPDCPTAGDDPTSLSQPYPLLKMTPPRSDLHRNGTVLWQRKWINRVSHTPYVSGESAQPHRSLDKPIPAGHRTSAGHGERRQRTPRLRTLLRCPVVDGSPPHARTQAEPPGSLVAWQLAQVAQLAEVRALATTTHTQTHKKTKKPSLYVAS